MTVVTPFVVIESDKSTNQIRKGLKSVRPGGDQICSVANPAAVPHRTEIPYKLLETFVFRAVNADR
jgi:hypothetical protein